MDVEIPDIVKGVSQLQLHPPMKKAFLLVAILSLAFAVGCGGGGPNTPPVNNGFSNSSLKGQYTYRIFSSAFQNSSNLPNYAEGGTFTADGNGNITSGVDDLVVGGSQLATSTSVSGSYSVASDGTGSIILNNTPLGSILGNSNSAINLVITLSSSSIVYLIEGDGVNSVGLAELQSSSVLSSTPSGTFAFRLHDSTVASRAGAFTVSGGTLAGSEDILNRVNGTITLDNGTGNPLSLSGSLTAPSGGRGSGSFSDTFGAVNFIYYVVDANNIRILRTDSGLVSLGRAEMQSGSFSTSSFSGNYAFGSRADDTNSSGGVNGQNTVGVVSADGNGNITGGSLDSVQDGNSIATNAAISGGGTDTVSPTGRVVVNYTSPIGAVTQVFWMVNSGRAFFLTVDSTKFEDGTADAQQSSSALTGSYAFAMDGFLLSSSFVGNLDRVGWISVDGNGNISLNEVSNSNGSPNGSGTLTGTYSTTTGRVAATINGLSQTSNDVVFYLASPSKAYVLQNTPGYEMFGTMESQ